MLRKFFLPFLVVLCASCLVQTDVQSQDQNSDANYSQFGLYAKTAPRPLVMESGTTQLPLELQPNDRIAFIGNTLFERSQQFGYFESMLHATFPDHRLVVRNLAWSGDEIDIQPRPENFADLEQHLYHERVDVIFAAYGFNESFAGEEKIPEFEQRLRTFLSKIRSLSFNGKSTARIVLVSPIANENVPKVNAGDLNNERLQLYTQAMQKIASEQLVGFADVFHPTASAMANAPQQLTVNGCHLNEEGDHVFAKALFQATFQREPSNYKPELVAAIVDRNRQYARRYRPLNTFYYTGGRNKDYGYLDFLPAMKSFDLMVANRDRRIWDIANGQPTEAVVDDSNVPPLPDTIQSRGANEWLSPQDELKAFKIDPRFEVNLFASEVEFPEIANPIQMRWDARGRMWVSTSITYPHIYPGNEPKDRIVILEDTDQDGRADKSTIFADNLHVPLSFELGDGGVYVSEQPELTFLQDTDGDDRADMKRVIFSGFGTEDSHHALHDFVWTPDGDLLFRESIFHHSQIETPYGPVRQQNSGWFRYTTRNERLVSFGTYPSTNPWGVTFDDWGRHVASHPIFAAAFHSLDPQYPNQHAAPIGLQAYSGTCGHEFVDFQTFPTELQNGFIKVRYKPTNRVEIHEWNRTEFGYEEKYVSDLLFSTNLSFIPVDIQFGPRGDLYVCDWYNPVKGHMQYSLRDTRRDRSSGRIWRIVAKDRALQEPPLMERASFRQLLDILKRPEYRYRYWAKRELRNLDADDVEQELEQWLDDLDPNDPRFRHHQIEAIWVYRGIGRTNIHLLEQLLECDDASARAAAVQQIRFWHSESDKSIDWLRRAIHDSDALVRMEAIIATSYVGSVDALRVLMESFQHPMADHLSYAVSCALGASTIKRHWSSVPELGVEKHLKQLQRANEIREPRVNAKQAEFDNNPNLVQVKIGCEPERMLFTVKQFTALTNQPVKVVFSNADATDHNMVFTKPGAMAEVGMAANEMAKDPKNADSDFIPPTLKHLILHASPMIGPSRKSKIHVFRFDAPKEPGVYPFVCTFPGHWVIMNGQMIVGRNRQEIEALQMSSVPKVVRQWKLTDFADMPELRLTDLSNSVAIERGFQAFAKANCQQCHVVSGHGVPLGPELAESIKKLQGKKLLQQILEPSSEIHPNHQNHRFLLRNGDVIVGKIIQEEDATVAVQTNLLLPNLVSRISKDEIEERGLSKISSMPEGLVDVLTRDEILDLVRFLEAGATHNMQHEHAK